MSEAGTQVGIARVRAGAVSTRQTLDETAVRAALAEVPDPELPMLSVVDLGIIHRVEIAPGDGPIRVEILPTFVACPALDLIKRYLGPIHAAEINCVYTTTVYHDQCVSGGCLAKPAHINTCVFTVSQQVPYNNSLLAAQQVNHGFRG